MPSKKKSKPSFQVPEELQKAPQAGWVYRSDQHTPAKEAKAAPKAASGSRSSAKSKHAESHAPASHAASTRHEAHAPSAPKAKTSAPAKKSSSSDSSSGILDLTAKALSAGFGTAGNLMLLTTRIIAAPVSLGRRLLGF
jgi:hypothetical protein